MYDFGKYGCQKCLGSGLIWTGRALDLSIGLPDGAVIPDVYIPELVSCRRCLTQGVYVSRAAAGLAEQ